MANASFVDALSSLRRKAQLSGRPLSQQETAGVVQAQAETANDRLYRAAQLQEDKDTRIAQMQAAKQARQDEQALRKRRWYDPTAWCIIVSVCTHRNSHEAEISRKYRDRFLSASQIGGYYRLASRVVPILERSSGARRAVKIGLVDRLVDYAEVALGYKPHCRFKTSGIIAKGFLTLCSIYPKAKGVMAWHCKH